MASPSKVVKPQKSPQPRVRKHHSLTAGRHPQKSKTLMRSALKKPVVKAQTSSPKKDKPINLGAPHKDRIKRAKTIEKSPKISRFNVLASSMPLKKETVPVRQASLEVKQPPAKNPVPTQADDWPVVEQFEKALQNASSHLEEFIDEAAQSKKGRKFAYATISLVFLAVLGVGAWQALPFVQVKMAASKAGFSASRPAYSPSGFSMDTPIETKPGEVTLSYKSRTDDKGFKITQTPSQWSSQALESNFLNSNNKEYQVVKTSGKTIYTYDKTNATWVDGGVWFKLESNADFSSEQIAKIANGL